MYSISDLPCVPPSEPAALIHGRHMDVTDVVLLTLTRRRALRAEDLLVSVTFELKSRAKHWTRKVLKYILSG